MFLRRWLIIFSVLVVSASCCLTSFLTDSLGNVDEKVKTQVASTIQALPATQTTAPTGIPAPTPTSVKIPTQPVKPPIPTKPEPQSSLGVPSDTLSVSESYSVEYPVGWQISQTGGWQDICSDDSKEICFHVQVEKGYKSLEQMEGDIYASFKSAVGDYQEYSREKITIHGIPALFFEHSYTFHDTYKQGYAALLANHGTGFYIQAEITGQMPPDEYSKTLKILKGMIESFKVLN